MRMRATSSSRRHPAPARRRMRSPLRVGCWPNVWSSASSSSCRQITCGVSGPTPRRRQGCGSIRPCPTRWDRCVKAHSATSRRTRRWRQSRCCIADARRPAPPWSSWMRSTMPATVSPGAMAYARPSTRPSGGSASAAHPSAPRQMSGSPLCPMRRRATRCDHSPTSPTPMAMPSRMAWCARWSSPRTRAHRAGSMTREMPSPPCSAAARRRTRTRPGVRRCHRPGAGCPTSSPRSTSGCAHNAPPGSMTRPESSSPTTRRPPGPTPRSRLASPVKHPRWCCPKTLMPQHTYPPSRPARLASWCACG